MTNKKIWTQTLQKPEKNASIQADEQTQQSKLTSSGKLMTEEKQSKPIHLKTQKKKTPANMLTTNVQDTTN